MAIYSKLLLFTFLIFGFFNKIEKHPLHVSTTEINFNPKDKSLEVTCRIFTDDFESALSEKFNTKTDLSKPTIQKAMDELIKKYLNANLRYVVNGKTLVAKYIGFEKDNEATNVYLEIENINQLQKIEVKNTILYDLFDDQMSILHVEKSGTRKSARTNYPNADLAVAF